ncbi:MAG: glycosyltransferase family 9 protein [Planctomycetota bacterium]|jgi:heptosyltransferase-1|nr:glycosyltransferase family 9 protein [Planctomycetota bacterium]MDP6761992.1 glycosyltransferase family 9 protein [Planctomycetota bacterium]MDP6989782.1 glycosyltransferase family 9 protein [Planctomycetota bacterium]
MAPQRIVIVRLSHLGDVVHSLPIYHALRATRPAAEIAWVVQPEFAEVVEGLPGLDRIILFDRRGGWRAWPRLRGDLARFRADWAIDAQGNLKSGLVTLCSGAGRRSGFARTDWTERAGSLFINDPAPVLPAGAQHAVDRTLHLARHVAAGFDPQDLPERWLEPRPDLIERAIRRHDEHLGEAAQTAWIVHLGAPGDVRTWPADHYRHLIARLAGLDRRVLVLSGPAEEEFGRRLAATPTPGVRHWVGQRGLRDLAASFCVAARRGVRLVACDSGPLHLAAACGVEVTALCGPQDPRRTGPWPPGRHHVVIAEPAEACAPCTARRCIRAAGPLCMSRIDPERVVEVLDSVDTPPTVDSSARPPDPSKGRAFASRGHGR